MRRRQAREHSKGFREGMRRHGHPVALVEPSLDFAQRCGMYLVPFTDGGNHATAVESEDRHLYPRPRRRSRLTRSTVVFRSAATLTVGRAIRRWRLRSNLT